MTLCKKQIEASETKFLRSTQGLSSPRLEKQ